MIFVFKGSSRQAILALRQVWTENKTVSETQKTPVKDLMKIFMPEAYNFN